MNTTSISMNKAVSTKHRWFVAASAPLALATAISLLLSSAVQAATKEGNRSGKEVVKAVCASCHETGANGAPKIGDKNAWATRATRGLTGLSQSALKGIRKMPSHGGNITLSDIEIERATAFMVNASGGRWAEPISKTAPVLERSGKEIVQTHCFKCHENGTGGAPKIGDRAAWAPRVKLGFETLTRSAINGHGSMPPRGGEANLTDAEIRASITYMFNPDAIAPKASPAAAIKPDPNHQIVDGVEIYFGAVSADLIRKKHTDADPESKMHGGIPSGKDYYHLNISLFDAKTKAAINGAQIEVKVVDPVMGDQVKNLETTTINNVVSYGNYFRLPGKSPYTITVLIRRPGASVIESKFSFRQ